MEMVGVRGEVRAVAGRLTLDVHLFDQAAGDQRLQAVVDRGHGDRGHAGLRAGVHLVGRGVIALVEQHSEDRLPLGGGPLAGMVQRHRQRLFIFLSKPSHGNRQAELE